MFMRYFKPFQLIPMRLDPERKIRILAISPVIGFVELTDFSQDFATNKQYGGFSVTERPTLPMTIEYTIGKERCHRVGAVARTDCTNVWVAIEDGQGFI